jgi:hypothetical protein
MTDYTIARIVRFKRNAAVVLIYLTKRPFGWEPLLPAQQKVHGKWLFATCMKPTCTHDTFVLATDLS